MTTPSGRRAQRLLRELQRLQAEFGPGTSDSKRLRLLALGHARLPRGRDVHALHEVLCFLRAHPDDAALLALVESQLEAFAMRADLRRHRAELADSGIAGTDLHYAFYAPTAAWLARCHPQRLDIDWSSVDARLAGQLMQWLESIVLPGELFGLYERKLGARGWIERCKRPDETDAVFLVRSFAQLAAEAPVRQRALEVLDVGFRVRGRLDTGTGAPAPGPSRTLARARGVRLLRGTRFQTHPLRRERPDLATALRQPPRSIRPVGPREARALIDLAREAMITRSRDLDSFAYADPQDVRLVDCGDGLQFACIGLQQEQRLVLEAVYGFLTLQNGVPIGYVLASALFRSSEIAYNVFETFRGGEAGWVYGRVVGMLGALFGSDAFTVYPYQLGHHNEEGLRSGAWWFYQKLGFRPRDQGALRLMQRELAAQRRDPRHRSDRTTLAALAAHNVYWSPRPARDEMIGVFPGEALSLAITDLLAQHFGSDRPAGEEHYADEAAERLGVRRWRRWPASERLAWRRWGPLLHLLPGLERWPADDRRALVSVIAAKGGRRESDYVRRFDAHRRLRRALALLARRLRRSGELG